MAEGLNWSTAQVSLSDKEQAQLSKWFATIWIAPSEYEAMPREEQIIYEELGEEAFLSQLYLTRTATPKR